MKILKNCLLILFSIIITLFIIEIYLSLFNPKAKNGSWRIQNEDGVYTNKDNGISKHEFIGEKEKISLTYKFGKFYNRIIFNDKYYKDKNRILVLGDSNIFGWLLEDKDTFIGRIQRYFDNYYFINSAAGGFSDTDTYLYLNRYCEEIKPEYILYFIDVNRSIRKKSMYFDETGKFIIKKNNINNLKVFLNDKKIFFFLLENSHLIQLLKQVYINVSNEAYIDFVKEVNPYFNKKKTNSTLDISEKNLKKEPELKEKNSKKEPELNEMNLINTDFELVKRLYNKILDKSNACNSKLIFIDTGWYNKSYNSKIFNDIVENFHSMFDENQDVKFISLYDEMRLGMMSDKVYKLEEGHPNTEGNILIYILLKDKLKFYLD
ncbi:hypothetical protein N8963_03105 [Candidatus Pelagibacter sp.]|nr:hypothetical protein [Candidatus Pelagibacter sp.]